jgi:hypothetical protein
LIGCNVSANTNVEIVSCEIFPGCPLSQYGDEVSLNLPADISSEQLFNIELKFDQPVTKVVGQLEGVSMYMGTIPVIFKAPSSAFEFQATTLVARCGSMQMIWRLVLSWQQGGKTHYGYRDLVVSH